jgi:inner membrane protein
VVLALAPDFDYFAWWLFGIDSQPRITHTLAFCIGAALLACAASAELRRALGTARTLRLFSLAACSHLALDLSVGVHGLPIFWPFDPHEYALPFGVLPSAGRLQLGNVYLWRNLLIEAGVLWPLLAAMLYWRRDLGSRALLRAGWIVAPAWLGFVAWSMSLER